jgi:hypothetical protein
MEGRVDPRCRYIRAVNHWRLCCKSFIIHIPYGRAWSGGWRDAPWPTILGRTVLAKKRKVGTSRSEDVPDPRDYEPFLKWLADKPPQWSVVIAARAALRLLPLVQTEQITAKSAAGAILLLFRATAVSRFVAMNPYRKIAEAAAAAAAAAEREVFASDAAVSAAVAAGDAARAAVFAAIAEGEPGSDKHEANRLVASDAAAAAYRDADAFGSANVTIDAHALYHGQIIPERLARLPLWREKLIGTPATIHAAWQGLAGQLLKLGEHWHVWIAWYHGVALGSPPMPEQSEAWEASFTDVPGPLPWDDGPEAVNNEIAKRLQDLQETPETTRLAKGGETAERKEVMLAELVEVASPQPSVTSDGRLDAGPNPTYDIPLADDDLPGLPIRQRTLIKVILGNLPLNTPKHLTSCLRFYDDELKARGVQPILGLLKDMADIIDVAVAAPHAKDEWLEPGLRQAFRRFSENHVSFVKHFPLDPQREDVYARIPVDEESATGQALTKPFEAVAKASAEAHEAGQVTPDYLAVIDKMTEFARVLSTQPPSAPSAPLAPNDLARATEIKIDPEDRIKPISPKKRTILSALGFLERSYNLAGSTVTLSGQDASKLMQALKSAVDLLWSLIRSP